MDLKNWKYIFSNDDLFDERKQNFKYYFEFKDFGGKHVHLAHQLEAWCEENFSEKFLIGGDYILCDSEEDFMAFRLKWF